MVTVSPDNTMGKIERVCENCGGRFHIRAYDAQRGKGRFCSRACIHEGTRTQIACTCQHCGTVFSTTPSQIARGRGKYCSHGCKVQSQIAHDETNEARFWSKVSKSEGCWEWTASCYSNGYGRFSLHGDWVIAHRYAYRLMYGPIPEGKEVCHRCDNRRCVRPDHFFLGTHDENIADMMQKGRSGRGEKKSRLREDDVRHIRSLYAEGGITQKEIGARFGVTQTAIWGIVHHRRWKYLE